MKNISKKRSNKKGFTLVELLAVIVILAVLVVLAMPSVLKIMNNAKKSAFETEVRSYLKAAQTEYTQLQTQGITVEKFVDGGAEATSTSTYAKLTTIDSKDGYHYSIELDINSDTQAIKYKYTVCNASFTAKSSDFVKLDDNDAVDAETTTSCTGFNS